jgi:uncharacterized protein (TIRG00374 family)
VSKRFHLGTAFLSLLVSCVAMALVLRHVDVGQALQTFAHVDGYMLMLPLAFFLSGIPVRALRWQLMFHPVGRPGFWSCFRSLAIGNAVNNLLPARAGDLTRFVLVGRRFSSAGITHALATVVMERVVDGLALVSALALSLCHLNPPRWAWHLCAISAAVFGGALMFCILLRYNATLVLTFVRRLCALVRLGKLGVRALRVLAAFTEGLGGVVSNGQALTLLLLTVAIWLADAGLIWGLAIAFHAPISFSASIFVSIVVGLATVVPAAPGGLGTYEFFGVAALALLGIDKSEALALIVGLHGWTFMTVTLLGMLCLSTTGIRLRQLRSGPISPADQ